MAFTKFSSAPAREIWSRSRLKRDRSRPRSGEGPRFVERVGSHAFDSAHAVVQPVARSTTPVAATTPSPPPATLGLTRCVREVFTSVSSGFKCRLLNGGSKL